MFPIGKRIALLGKKNMYSDKARRIQAANLIGYWPLNGNANDISGYGYHGTTSNVTWTSAGWVDGSLCATFAGNGYVNVFSAALAAAFNGSAGSVSMWQQVSAVGDWNDAAWRSTIDITVDGANSVSLAKRNTLNNFYFSHTSGGNTESRTYLTAGPTAWFHTGITWTIPGDQVIYYYAGAAVETDTVLSAWAGTIVRFLLGAQTIALAQPWKGNIKDVGLWNTPLSGAQMAILATATP